jgi:hypothetical protein
MALSKISFKLILILISIIVVAVIMIIIMELIKGGSEEIDFDDLTLDLEISQVEIINDSTLEVTVVRNPGSGQLVSLNFIVQSENNSEIIQKNVSLDELQMKTFDINLEKINTKEIIKVEISIIFKIESGDIKGMKYNLINESSKIIQKT